MIWAPVIQPPNARFDGIGTLLMKKSSAGPSTAIWLHGMCSHFDDWAHERATVMQKYFGGKVGEPTTIVVPETGIHIRRYELITDGHSAYFNFVLWSKPSIDRKRERLCYDNEFARIGTDESVRQVCTDPMESKYFPFPRAELNGRLKTVLMNDCLADAVFYAGANGKSLREAVRKALCIALSDGDSSNADCGKPLKLGDIVLVSESLGSKVLFDSVACSDMATSTRSCRG